MNPWIVLAAVIGPAVFWIGYFYFKDRRRPEPIAHLFEAFGLGFLAAFFCFLAYGLLPRIGIPGSFHTVVAAGDPLTLLLYSVGVVGLLEETFKFIPFALVILRLRAFDEKIDGVIYAAAIAVGFASFENIGYLPFMKGWELVGRAVASPLTHTIFASIWGYMVGVAKIKGKSLVGPAAAGVALSAIVHGLFNFLTISPSLRGLSALLILVIWIWVIRLLEKEGRRTSRDAAA